MYQRTRWKHYIRYFGLACLVGLNVSTTDSLFRVMNSHGGQPLQHFIYFVALTLLFDLVIILPVLFEVDTILVTPDWITLKTLFWQTKIPWESITGFDLPAYMRVAIIRTRRCFYVINKKDILNSAELFQTIQFKSLRSQPRC